MNPFHIDPADRHIDHSGAIGKGHVSITPAASTAPESPDRFATQILSAPEPIMPTRPNFCIVLTALLVASLLTASSSSAQSPRKPNVILILADDLGAKELGCYGNTKHQTPNLDRMAREGARFETFFANPLCTPTRVTLMTGQYGHHNGFLGMSNPAFKPSADSPQAQIGNHFTHADLMKSQGYATAQVGKWQLSGSLPTLVRDAGFDEYRMWAYDHNLPAGIKHPTHERGDSGNACRYWHPSIVENGQYLPTTPDDYGPDLFNAFVLDFARRHKDQPFFVYYTSVLTHGPHLETPDPANPGKRLPANFKSNVEYLDHLMGQLLAGLKAEGLDDNTYVIFIGDNGTANSGKGTLTELGARVPGIIRGPSVRPGLVTGAVADLTDIMPTLAELAGVKLPTDRPFDGHSLLPVIQGKAAKHRDWAYSHLDDGRILRDQRWLLEVAKGNDLTKAKFFDCGDSRDGAGYKEVTASADPEARAARARFDAILAAMPEPKPNRATAKDNGDGAAPGKATAKTAAKPKPDRTANFARRDRDGNGLLTREEFLATLQNDNQAAGETRFTKLDADRNGELTPAEFLGTP
jgi:arylsulfatase A